MLYEGWAAQKWGPHGSHLWGLCLDNFSELGQGTHRAGVLVTLVTFTASFFSLLLETLGQGSCSASLLGGSLMLV